MADLNEIGGVVRIKRTHNKQWVVSRIAANGEPLAHTENLTQLHYAKALAERLYPGVEVQVEDGSE